jgi:hypothetical protein
MNKNMENKISQNVLDKIKSNEVQMTSKKFFVMKWTTLLLTSAFFLILGVYVFAYVIFLFVDNGLMVIPFGMQGGIMNFIVEIPWTLVLIGLLSVFMFSITSKTFYKIYRKPFLTFFFTVFICILLSHILLMETGTMKLLKEEAFKNGIKLAPEKLLNFRESQTRSIYVGNILEIATGTLKVVDRKGVVSELILENELKNMEFLVGQKINAYVISSSSLFYAKSIEIVD